MSFIDSKHPRGPARWERAALNAIRKPNSRGAALYRDRTMLARTISLGHDQPLTAFEFVNAWEGPVKREYVTCSVFCTIMEITLDFGTLEPRSIAQAFANSSDLVQNHRGVRRLDRTTLSRTVRCQVCGGKVKP